MSDFIIKYQEKVQQQILSIEQDILSLKKSVKPVAPDNAIGRLTRMEAINAKAVAEANLRSAEGRQLKLKAILKRLAENPEDLRVCQECGEAIAEARLLARPESTRCVECVEIISG